jgi:hypothetical protein
LLGNFAILDETRKDEIINLIDSNSKHYNTYYLKKIATELLNNLRGEAPEEKKSVFC